VVSQVTASIRNGVRTSVDWLFAGDDERPLTIARALAAAVWLVLNLWLVGLTPSGPGGFPPVSGLERAPDETANVRSWLDTIAAGAEDGRAPDLSKAGSADRAAVARAFCGSRLDGGARRARADWLRERPGLCGFMERRAVLAPFSLAMGPTIGLTLSLILSAACAVTLWRLTETFRRTRNAYRLLYASGHLADRASAEA
jgi:hypothetical protein